MANEQVVESASTTVTRSIKNGNPAKMAKPWTKLGILFGVAAVFIIFGVTVGILWSSIFNGILVRQLTLTPSSRSFKMWEETPVPMYMEFYLYNWTNHNEFSSSSKIKPNFVQMGPYVFRQVDYKVNNVWNDNGTVSFQRKRVWHFEASMSNGSLSDNVTNINVVATTVAYFVRHKSEIMRKVVDSLIRHAEASRVITKTAGELIFDGYDDLLLKIGSLMNSTLDKFGWYYGRNNSATYEGMYNMLTGESNILDLGKIVRWNYSNRTNYYGSCGLVNGTNGDLWYPPYDAERITVFSSDLCTSMSLSFENTTEIHGLLGHKFVSDEATFDNGKNVPSRACYCHDVECQPSGTLNVSTCKFGAPAFISFPHFYLADESYRNAITGMNPVKEEHEFAISLEPETGIPMQVKAQVQINILVQPDSVMSLFKDVPRTYIPVLWSRQTATLSSDLLSEVKFILTLPTLGHATFFGICSIGILLLFIGAVLCVRRRWREDENQILLPEDERSRTGATER